MLEEEEEDEDEDMFGLWRAKMSNWGRFWGFSVYCFVFLVVVQTENIFVFHSFYPKKIKVYMMFNYRVGYIMLKE